MPASRPDKTTRKDYSSNTSTEETPLSEIVMEMVTGLSQTGHSSVTS